MVQRESTELNKADSKDLVLLRFDIQNAQGSLPVQGLAVLNCCVAAAVSIMALKLSAKLY